MNPHPNFRNFTAITLILLTLMAPGVKAFAQVPGLLNYQGRVLSDGVPFHGTGQFKFALVNGDGSVTHWSNDGSSAAGAQPTAGLSLPVNQGTYSVLLGDTTLAGMTTVPATVFANSDVRLRVWFNDGTHGFQLLTPDQRIAAVGYALALADGAVNAAQLAPALNANLAKLNSSPTFTGTVTAAGFEGPVNAAQLSGTVNDARLSPNIPRLNAAGSTFSGIVYAQAFQGDGAGVTNLNAGALQGVVGDIHLSTNIAKLNSSSTFTGNLTAPGFFGGGAGLTGLNAGALSTGTVPDARLAGNVARLDGAADFAGTVEAPLFVGSGAGLVNLGASRLVGTVPDARLSDNIPRLDGNPAFSGVVTAEEFRGKVPGSVQWKTVAGTSQQTVVGEGYLLTGNQPVTLTLPASPAVGDVVRIANVTAPSWRLNQNAGQSVLVTNLMGPLSDTNWVSIPFGSNYPLDGETDTVVLGASSRDGNRMYVVVEESDYDDWSGESDYTSTVYWSIDGGHTWTWGNREYGDRILDIAVSANGRNAIAVGDRHNVDNQGWGIIWRTTNGGRNWTESIHANRVYSVASSITGQKLVMGDTLRLHTSTNGGAAWTPRGPQGNYWVSVASSGDGVKLAAVGRESNDVGYVFVSQDSGQTWTARDVGRKWLHVALSEDGATLAAAGYDVTLRISRDFGLTWRDTGLWPFGSKPSVSRDGSVIAIESAGQIGISRDGGNTWMISDIDGLVNGLVMASDGTKMLGLMDTELLVPARETVPTSTVGPAGYLVGGNRSAVELVYAGAGRFLPVSSTGTLESQ